MNISTLRPGSVFILAAVSALAACERTDTGDNATAVPEQPPFEVVEATIAGIQDAIVTGRTSCQAVVRSYLDRIEAYDQPSGLNAITEINPRALERAASIDEAVAGGKPLGPLFCAPVLVKDNFDTHDLPTTGGSIALAGNLPPDDAFMVRKLRAADAIVLAKTNMAEWAFSPAYTVSSSYGVTANAYSLDRVPAGSSGGTASGVAASFGVAGLGSDTGNSIRGPSSHLALAGIRSTLGLTSRDGVIPLAFDRDIAGPMARTVEDMARLFDVVAGHDPSDPLSEAGKREENYTAYLKKDGLAGARIGVLRAHADPDDTDPEILLLFEAALDDLRNAGAQIIDPVEVPNWTAHKEADSSCSTFRYDMARYLETLGEAAPFGDVKEAFDAGLYAEESREDFEWYLDYPADIAPVDWDPPCPVYLDHPARRSFLDDVTMAMDEAAVETLVFPTWRYPPAKLGTGYEDYRGDNSQLIAPSTGMPAITVPMGYTSSNLPAGLKILGRRYSDGVLIQHAYAYEQATGHRKPPASFPSLRLQAAEKSEPVPKALFMIVDGIPADVIEAVDTPHLDEIAAAGGYARAYLGGAVGTESESPTISAVGYNSLLTGTWSNKHNVWDNEIEDPDYSYWDIFRIAKTHNPELKTAVFSTWLDNRTKLLGDGLAQAGGNKVDYHFDGFEHDTERFPHDEEGHYIRRIDELVVGEAARYVAENGPDLSWIYLQFTDDVSHLYGDGPEFEAAVRQMDEWIGSVWASIKQRQAGFSEDWLLVVTTDHGRDTATGMDHGGQSERERTIWIATNSERLNDNFEDMPAIVDILPSLATHLDLEIPEEVSQKLDGRSFID